MKVVFVNACHVCPPNLMSHTAITPSQKEAEVLGKVNLANKPYRACCGSGVDLESETYEFPKKDKGESSEGK